MEDSIETAPNTKLAGEDLTMVVACPECATRGRVRLRQLPHVMHCPSCRVRFWIAKDGKLKSEHRCQKVRFECPCCHGVQQIPREFTSDGITCHDCGKRSVVDSEGQFRTEGERTATREPEKSAQQTPSKRRLAMLTSGRTLIAAAAIAVVVVAFVILGGLAEESLESVALQFTEDCLHGDQQAAADKVCAGGDDDLARWSIVALRQTQGGAANVAIQSTELAADEAQVRLIVDQRKKGRRLLTQYWRRIDGRWRFDATKSLSRLTAPE